MASLNDEMKKVLAEHSLGYVASIAADGSPSLSPKATFLSFGENKIMFGEMFLRIWGSTVVRLLGRQ